MPQRPHSLSQLEILGTGTQAQIDRIVEIAATLFRVPSAMLVLADADEVQILSRYGAEGIASPCAQALCRAAVLCPDVLTEKDMPWDGCVVSHAQAGGAHVRFFAGQSVRLFNGCPVGVLCILGPEPREFSEAEQRQLSALAVWVERELSSAFSAESEASLRLLGRFFELCDDILVISSREGNMLMFNESTVRTLGYEPEELRALRIQDLIHPEDLPTVNREIFRITQGTTHLSFDYRMRCHNGEWRWLQCHCSFSVSDGLFYGVSRDVTEQKRLEDEQRRVEEMKNEFISTVSHELRTPLTSICGSLSLLEGGVMGPVPEPMEEMIHIASKNGHRLLRLINDILDLQKVEAGQMDFRPEAVPLEDFLVQTAEAHQGYAAKYQVRVELEPHAPGAQVWVDPDRLSQVVANLLSNAIKFSPSGERVVLRLERLGDKRLRLSVEDHGPGIPEAFRRRVFQKFAQGESPGAQRKGGTGLGLAIARTLVERMGGTLDFVTSEGQGTTFRVTLPEWIPFKPEMVPR